MSSKRTYDLFKVYPLGNFFICVFLFVGCIASFWYFHRRTNSYAHQREDGIDVMAPTYQTPNGEKLDKELRESRMKAPQAKTEKPEAAETKTEEGTK